MKDKLGPAITKAASRQTYYTIRFLVDRPRVQDAYRAYAYFRWVDDTLDAEGDVDRVERTRFLARQKSLLDHCLRGEPAPDANAHEALLVELVRHAGPADIRLETYLRQMMLVMEFDVRRRGRLISQAELDRYTGCLAAAVSAAMHSFIGGGAAAPDDETRGLAVSGAHILHMLRDTYVDTKAGYFNVPRELLEAHSIGPEDVHADAYRAWVEGRVRLARAHLDAGRRYYARVPSRRHRLAGLAYSARFEWLIEALERDDFRLRPAYRERDSLPTGLRMAWHVISSMTGFRSVTGTPAPIASTRDARP